ncbi:MAG: DUF3800 domain-containing protein [Acidobacteriia bacterium]|nr:DUF3800 domain-containing protein [Terriglobia bacterium]
MNPPAETGYFDRLLEILCPDGRGLVAMMEAYFDESGTHTGSPVMCVAGFLFNPRNCRALERQWRSKLETVRRKHPKVKYFHMKELAPGGGQFLGVPDDERQEIERHLVGLINQRKTYGIVVATKPDDFYNTMPTKWIEQYGHAYTTLCRHCVHVMGHWADKHHHHGRIAYFFESGAQHQAETNGLLAGIASDAVWSKKLRYGSHTFADKRVVLPLQAADVGAWQFVKFEIDTRINQRRPARKSLVALMGGRGDDSAYQLQYLTADNLKGLLAANPIR